MCHLKLPNLSCWMSERTSKCCSKSVIVIFTHLTAIVLCFTRILSIDSAHWTIKLNWLAAFERAHYRCGLRQFVIIWIALFRHFNFSRFLIISISTRARELSSEVLPTSQSQRNRLQTTSTSNANQSDRIKSITPHIIISHRIKSKSLLSCFWVWAPEKSIHLWVVSPESTPRRW